MAFLLKAWSALNQKATGKKHTKWNVSLFYLVFLVTSAGIVYNIPTGFSNDFLDYIKDVFAIFVGFFSTTMVFVFDRLEIKRIPTEEENNSLPTEERLSSKDIMEIKKHNNYTLKFSYSLGLNIIYSVSVLLLLLVNVLWADFMNLDLSEITFINSWYSINFDSIFLFLHVCFVSVYRIIIIFLILSVFVYTVYSTSSLLQVIKKEKKFKLCK